MVEHSVLHLYVDETMPWLVSMYEAQAAKHNEDVMTGSHPNSGFDLFLPENYSFEDFNAKFVNYKVKCEMISYETIHNTSRPGAFYLYPRSSISKTMLMLANHVGIIDSGYRGNIIAAFRLLTKGKSQADHMKGERLVQICAPDLRPFLVKLVDEKFLSSTERGNGGFGSTGK